MPSLRSTFGASTLLNAAVSLCRQGRFCLHLCREKHLIAWQTRLRRTQALSLRLLRERPRCPRLRCSTSSVRRLPGSLWTLGTILGITSLTNITARTRFTIAVRSLLSHTRVPINCQISLAPSGTLQKAYESNWGVKVLPHPWRLLSRGRARRSLRVERMPPIYQQRKSRCKTLPTGQN